MAKWKAPSVFIVNSVCWKLAEFSYYKTSGRQYGARYVNHKTGQSQFLSNSHIKAFMTLSRGLNQETFFLGVTFRRKHLTADGQEFIPKEGA